MCSTGTDSQPSVAEAGEGEGEGEGGEAGDEPEEVGKDADAEVIIVGDASHSKPRPVPHCRLPDPTACFGRFMSAAVVLQHMNVLTETLDDSKFLLKPKF